MFRPQLLIITPVLLALAFIGCDNEKSTINEQLSIKGQGAVNFGKADTAYYNPNGVEVEVDLEGDLVAPLSPQMILNGPAELGQYAMTYLRKRSEFFIESLAEDGSSIERSEWLVEGKWTSAREVAEMLDASTKMETKHFRIRGLNTVLLNKASDGVAVGKVFTAKVPLDPFSTMEKYGELCADKHNHLDLHQGIYWYQWNPEKEGCKAEIQDMTITVSKVFESMKIVYPEYDKLVADKKVTAVLMFGQTGDKLLPSDDGFLWAEQIGEELVAAGYQDVIPAPLGRRYAKDINNITMEIDIYGPNEFAGLDDVAHLDNLQKAIGEHEIVSYAGHSMLGASDIWSKPQYPSTYQIFLYSGCLGYEYYLRQIAKGKGGFENLDIIASVVEVPVLDNYWVSIPVLQIAEALAKNYQVSWQDIVAQVQKELGNAVFGVSGVRDNLYRP